MSDYKKLGSILDDASYVTIVQAENPDADSLGSALALDDILRHRSKNTFLHCAVDIPRYLRYIDGWERVSSDWPERTDVVVVVDTSARSLLEKSLVHFSLEELPVVVLDHHLSEGSLAPLAVDLNRPNFAATGELIYDFASTLEWAIPRPAAVALLYSILADTLGLISKATTTDTVNRFAQLVALHDIPLHELEDKRRELGKKPLSILKYKFRLLQRMQLHFDNQLATVDIPLEEIKEYSDLYNPGALFMEEVRSVEQIRMAIAFKTYEDHITAKLREVNDAPFCDQLAKRFGGGGHPFAAGFKVAETDTADVKKRVLKAFYDLLEKQD